MLMFSLSNKKSFEDLTFSLKEIRLFGGENPPIFLVGNKTDLIQERVVSRKEAERFAEQNGIKLYLEISAKTKHNVEYLFETVAQHVCFALLD